MSPTLKSLRLRLSRSNYSILATVNSVGLEQIDEAAIKVKSFLKVDIDLLYRAVSL
jgi:hypothetical protein